ncbi:MAG: molybdopterin-guanine dinucleotide biosynthesis protein B [Rhodocyclaceae bacterium]|nr:molybdopterin-guanine dinucleotide biosynthesis protein B [Rhodocyclaceae bacterium]
MPPLTQRFPVTCQFKVFGFAGFSGSGKTTLIERVIPLLTARGLRVSLVKHAHHDFDIDKPGKDSHRHREAGASEVLVSGGKRWALMHELRSEPEPGLAALLAHLSPCDLVLVEGFKHDAIPKLEVHRPALGHPLLSTQDAHIVGIASDAPVASPLPQIDLNDPVAVADFVVAHADRHAAGAHAASGP